MSADTWFSAQDLAGLPGLPDTARAVKRLAAAEGWDSNPTLSRRRRGKGGGREYNLAALPHVTRNYLARRALRIEGLNNATIAADQIPTGSKAGQRQEAALVVLALWDPYKVATTGAIENARAAFCQLYNSRAIPEAPDWLFEIRPSLSVKTLRTYEQRRNRGNVGELGGRFGNRRGSATLETALDGRVARFIQALIVAHPHLTAPLIRDQVIAEFGDHFDGDGAAVAVPPVRAFQRYIKTWKTAHAEAFEKATNPDQFKNRRRIRGRNMNAWVERPNHLWEIDASPADVLLKDGRHSIYAVVDIYTRRLLVSVSKTARTDAMLALVRRAIIDWGVPDTIRTDNGSDFKSHAAVTAFASLEIRQDITAPYSPEQKGTVERTIGTLQRNLMTLLPGFIGHDVADRKQIEARRSFAQRLGESEASAFCVDLTRDDLQAYVDEWCATKYANTPHRSLDGMTPSRMASDWTKPVQRIQSERALDLLLAPIASGGGFRRVTAQGIRLDGAHFLHPDLVPGADVFCRYDPDDLGRIYVYREDRATFVCVAECPERIGVNPGDAVRAMQEEQKRRTREEIDPLKREIRRMKPRDMVDRVLGRSRDENGSVTEFPRPATAYTTPALQAAETALQADNANGAPIDPVSTAGDPPVEGGTSSVVVNLPETPKQRFARARALQAAIDRGEPVDPHEAKWLGGYEQTSEYRGHAAMEEDFGEDWMTS